MISFDIVKLWDYDFSNGVDVTFGNNICFNLYSVEVVSNNSLHIECEKNKNRIFIFIITLIDFKSANLKLSLKFLNRINTHKEFHRVLIWLWITERNYAKPIKRAWILLTKI